MSLGLLFALVALVGWAIGDYFIQKTVKRIGVIESLFFICALGFFILLPFVYDKIQTLGQQDIFSLTLLGFLIFIFAVLLFKAFQIGKLSVSESVVALELPLTVLLGILVLKENISDWQMLFTSLSCIGIFLSTLKYSPKTHHIKIFLEKGFLFALGAAGLSALTNIFVGTASQNIDPFVTIWFSHSVVAVICFVYLTLTGSLANLYTDFSKNKFIVSMQSLIDNIAWTAFALSVVYIPISISIAISEAYIVLAASFGYFINKEKLNKNQKIGMILTFIAVICLAFTVNH